MKDPTDLIIRINKDLWRISYILESGWPQSEISSMMRFYGFQPENRIGIVYDFQSYLREMREKLKIDWEAHNI